MRRIITEEWSGEGLTLERLADIIRRDGISGSDWAFLDSSLKGPDGRYSILGLYPYLEAEEREGELFVNGERRTGDLLAFLKDYIENNRDRQNRESGTGGERKDSGPVMTAGAIGWLSYDYGRKRAEVPGCHESDGSSVDGGLPDGRFVFYDLYLVEDLLENRIWICTGENLSGIGDYREKVRMWAGETACVCAENVTNDKRIVRNDPDRMEEREKAVISGDQGRSDAGEGTGEVIFSSDYGEEDYEETIRRLVEYMRAGDIYVMNMTRRITAEHIGDPYQMFRYLRKHNPSPFGAFLSFGEYEIVCASPERFLRVRDGAVETSPIKGTRKRGDTPEEDQRLRQELVESEKDKSELLMIVDLERNDLNRVCVPGSVKVPRMYYIESFATVHHLISDVTGRLRPECSAVDLLDAAFPGGSITGAPKRRAMEIIDEQENSSRGLYTGVIGYLGLDGNCDFNIVIRTAVCRNGCCSIGVGGGITVDSDPEFEYEETNQKAAALLEAIRAVNHML
ncbi:MAG: aminodeoxychorismate synthase component I [Eubacterium sp.]|nr:aminodeoxychorismate synthase component I [Eubacterium sp.]